MALEIEATTSVYNVQRVNTPQLGILALLRDQIDGLQESKFLRRIKDACGIATKHQREALKYVKTEWRRAFLCTDHETPVGYLEMSIHNRDDVMYVEIDRIGVLPDFQRKGIGTMLLSYAEHEARSCGAKYLELDYLYNNVQAKSLYKKLGYIDVDSF